MEWDIHLCQINDWKSELASNNEILGDYRKDLLLAKSPRFIWRAIAHWNNQKELELIFDATDINQGGIFIKAVEYKNNLSKIVSTIANAPGIERQLNSTPSGKIFAWFK